MFIVHYQNTWTYAANMPKKQNIMLHVHVFLCHGIVHDFPVLSAMCDVSLLRLIDFTPLVCKPVLVQQPAQLI